MKRSYLIAMLGRLLSTAVPGPFVAASLVAGSLSAVLYVHPVAAAPFVVAPFSGSKPQGMRKAVAEAMQAAGYEVVPEDKSPDIDSKADEAEFATVALDEGLRGFVYGNTALGMGSWTLTLEVRSGATGEVVGKRTLKGKTYDNLRAVVAEKLEEVMKGSLERAEPAASAKVAEAPAAEEPPEEKKEEAAAATEPKAETPDAESQDESETASVDLELGSSPPKTQRAERLPALILGAGPRFVVRDWALSDSLIGGNDGPISPTHVVPFLGIGGQLTVYPGAFAGPGPLQYIGLEARGARSFVGETEVPGDSDPRKTTFKEFSGALRGRVPLGDVVVGAFLGYGRNDLILAGEKKIATQPDVKYAFVQAGVDGQLGFGSLAVDGRLEYRHVLGVGENPTRDLQGDRWFPNSEGRGFLIDIGAGYALGGGLGLRLGGTFANYVMSFNPKVGELEAIAAAGRPAPPIAGGASDLYYGGDLSLTYALMP